MQVKEAVQQASVYLPTVFESATGRDLRLEGVEKTEDGRFWTVTFSYENGNGSLGRWDREYKTVKLRDVNGDFIGARNGMLLGEM